MDGLSANEMMMMICNSNNSNNSNNSPIKLPSLNLLIDWLRNEESLTSHVAGQQLLLQASLALHDHCVSSASTTTAGTEEAERRRNHQLVNKAVSQLCPHGADRLLVVPVRPTSFPTAIMTAKKESCDSSMHQMMQTQTQTQTQTQMQLSFREQGMLVDKAVSQILSSHSKLPTSRMTPVRRPSFPTTTTTKNERYDSSSMPHQEMQMQLSLREQGTVVDRAVISQLSPHGELLSSRPADRVIAPVRRQKFPTTTTNASFDSSIQIQLLKNDIQSLEEIVSLLERGSLSGRDAVMLSISILQNTAESSVKMKEPRRI